MTNNRNREFKWPANRRTTRRTRTDVIAVHCSATPEGRWHDATDIDNWHIKRGWAGIGYHFVVRLDGSLEEGRPIDTVGSHAAGNNSNSIAICYIGGVARDGRTAKDTRTEEQKTTMRWLLKGLKARFRNARIQGHRDYPGVAKACPSFDARTEYADL